MLKGGRVQKVSDSELPILSPSDLYLIVEVSCYESLGIELDTVTASNHFNVPMAV